MSSRSREIAHKVAVIEGLIDKAKRNLDIASDTAVKIDTGIDDLHKRIDREERRSDMTTPGAIPGRWRTVATHAATPTLQ